MNEQQQKLYDKLLKKVNEYCLGVAAEDVIAAIDALVENYETNISAYRNFCDGFTYYFNGEKITLTDLLNRIKALEIIKKQIHSLSIYKGNFYFDGERISKEEYELLKEVFKDENTN